MEPWSLQLVVKSELISSHQGWTRRLIPWKTEVANVWTSREVDRLLKLLYLHPRLHEVVLRTLWKRYEGIAHLHFERDCARAALSNWRLPKTLEKFLQQGTKAAHVRGFFPIKHVRRLFPKLRAIVYYPGAFPLRTGENWFLSLNYRELYSGSWDMRFVTGAETYLRLMNQGEFRGPDVVGGVAVRISFRAEIQENCACGEWHHAKDGVVDVQAMNGRYRVVGRMVVERDSASEPEVVWKHVGSCKLKKLRDLETSDERKVVGLQQDELVADGEYMKDIFGWRDVMTGLFRLLFRRRLE